MGDGHFGFLRASCLSPLPRAPYVPHKPLSMGRQAVMLLDCGGQVASSACPLFNPLQRHTAERMRKQMLREIKFAKVRSK